MKKYFSLLFVLIYCHQLNAQAFHTVNTNIDENLVHTIQDKYGNYISCGRATLNDDFTGNNFQGILYKLNEHGKLIKKKLVGDETNSVSFTYILEKSNSYLFFGNKKYNDGNWYTYIIETDNDFNLIKEKKLGAPYFESTWTVNAIALSNKIIICANGISSTSPWIQNAIIYNLNNNLDSITSNILFSEVNNGICDAVSILLIPNNLGFKISSTSNYVAPVVQKSGIWVTNFDNTFNIISTSLFSTFIPNNSVNNIIPNSGDIHWLNDSIYVMGIQGSYWQEPFDFTKSGNDVVTLYINSKNDSILYYNILGKKDSSDLANYINVSVANENTVYCGGTHRMSSNAYMYDKEVSWLMVNKQAFYGSGVTTEWEYFYGGDARYRHTHVLATRDGGCLITARRYDTSGVFLSDAFFLKIQEDGTPYPVGGINKIKKSIAITLSPNPANDIITATFSENTYKEIGIINLQGETIFKQELQNNLSLFKINTNSFASGTYSIYFKEKETGFGIAKKIVIQH